MSGPGALEDALALSTSPFRVLASCFVPGTRGALCPKDMLLSLGRARLLQGKLGKTACHCSSKLWGPDGRLGGRWGGGSSWQAGGVSTFVSAEDWTGPEHSRVQMGEPPLRLFCYTPMHCSEGRGPWARDMRPCPLGLASREPPGPFQGKHGLPSCLGPVPAGSFLASACSLSWDS